MSLHDCVINWDAPATLKDVSVPTTALPWVGAHIYAGTVAGAIRTFMSLPAEQQKRIEMLIDPGVIADHVATIVTHDSLQFIAGRPDLPKN